MINNNAEQAINDIASRRIYQPYFKARWQNMQNMVNDSVFYTKAPAPYLTYYTAFIKQWMQWATGFVPMLHKEDFFSTGLAYTCCCIFETECMAGGFRLNSSSRNLIALIKKTYNLYDKFSEAFFWANAGGNAFFCLTPVNGTLKLRVIPINRIIFSISNDDSVNSAELYNSFVTASDRTFYTRELRCIYNGNSYYKVELYEGGPNATAPAFGGSYLKEIPLEAKDAFFDAYGAIELNTWYKLPNELTSVGLYNVKNKSVAVALSGLPGYSDSSLHTALDVFYSIDYNYTQQQLDSYYGKSRVLIPPEMQLLNVGDGKNNFYVSTGLDFREAINGHPLDQDLFLQVPGRGSIDGSPAQPTFIQPDLRAEAHKYLRDADLELLASKLGLSSSTLANHLSYIRSKTATQVETETDTTERTVAKKRDLADRAINAMLTDIATYYGYVESISITWNKTSQTTATDLEQLRADYQAGLLPRKEYLKRRWRDLSEEEINRMAEELEEEDKKKQARAQKALFGDFDI